ncbi:hypothetical protein [Propionivibrio dicarboxylicus]|uniref:hypothetical protein n=1 Tax=Propionivibrio dicarboxylicus TaxID=83767 RepID=UPI0015A0611E|nr:hypothetical protein [Propionivibrio dicarboxylicus]
MSFATGFAALFLLVACINVAGFFRIRLARRKFGLPEMTPADNAFEGELSVQMAQ